MPIERIYRRVELALQRTRITLDDGRARLPAEQRITWRVGSRRNSS
jgi:hypothetical protein